MLAFYRAVIFVQFLDLLNDAHCSIPTLSVNKINRKVVEKKRQDTLELCRMFHTENQMDSYAPLKHRRVKRGTPSPQNINDDERVENIVDKLYDDVRDGGEKVTYRQKVIPTTTTAKTVKGHGRRFNFAPAFLEGPLAEPLEEPKIDGNAPIPWHKHWKHGIIPFFIDSKTYDSTLAEQITDAFDHFERRTCIRLERLRERPTDKESLQKVEWLYITNPSGTRQCVHSNAYKPNIGVQMVVFGYDCMSLGEILHEVMHILGFSHEHVREDRDHYISVMWDNIKPGYKKYFEIQHGLLSLPYDYESVLHYPPRAFSKNGKFTLMAEPGVKFGQRERLSQIDVEKVSMIFGNECMNRNKEYLLNTCPTAISTDKPKKNVTQNDINDYFKDRLWPFGIINYKLKDKMEFSIEEKENIDAVIKHIEKETCIEFRDLTADDEDDNPATNGGSDENSVTHKLSTADVESNTENISDNNIETTPESVLENGVESATEVVPTDVNTKDENEMKEDEPNDSENKIESDNVDKLKEESSKEDENGIIVDHMKQPVASRSNFGTIINNRDLNDEARRANKEITKRASFKIKIPQRKSANVTNKLNEKLKKKPLNAQPPRVKRVRRAAVPLSPSRRHAEDILVLTRSPEPGCPCPTPGRPNGDKVLVINSDCFNSVNDLLHLFVHVLGLDHQHNMYDRDAYLAINWTLASDELKQEMTNLLPPAASVGFTYDYQSVMHYPWLQIKNGITNVMYPIWNDGWAMGHWQGLSTADVQKLNLLYFDQCQLRKKHIARTYQKH
ncbi:uncharacterized protein [Choristoneura fumiferana]|uniref:uncharacterized protein n=1 Tax=Choristoneura fumiferana TaxID=7141 RepID=UPI003D15385E